MRMRRAAGMAGGGPSLGPLLAGTATGRRRRGRGLVPPRLSLMKVRKAREHAGSSATARSTSCHGPAATPGSLGSRPASASSTGWDRCEICSASSSSMAIPGCDAAPRPVRRRSSAKLVLSCASRRSDPAEQARATGLRLPATFPGRGAGRSGRRYGGRSGRARPAPPLRAASPAASLDCAAARGRRRRRSVVLPPMCRRHFDPRDRGSRSRPRGRLASMPQARCASSGRGRSSPPCGRARDRRRASGLP